MQDKDLVGIYEIAEMANVSPAAVANWRKRYPNFPLPIAELRSGPIFQRNQIAHWLRQKEGSMAKVIALFNNKGGVGKTTTIWNLAASLAEQNKKVLLIDFDPQCNLSIAVLGEAEFSKCLTSSQELPYGKTVKAFILPYIQQNSEAIAYTQKPTKIAETMPSHKAFDIVPGDFWLNHFSDVLNVGTEVIGGAGLYRFLTPHALIAQVEKQLDTQYDFALIDLPPSFNTLVRAALYSSDYFIVPCTPDSFSAYCVSLIGQVLPRFIKDWEQGKERYTESNPHDEIISKKGRPRFGGWIFNGFDTRKKPKSTEIVKTSADELQFNQVKKSIEDKLLPKLKEITVYDVVPTFIGSDPVATIEDLNIMAPDSILQNVPIQYLLQTGPTRFGKKVPKEQGLRKGSWNPGQKALIKKTAQQYEQLAKLIINQF